MNSRRTFFNPHKPRQRTLFLGAAALLLVLLGQASVSAQPMMFNPAQMSGIPRIEPKDPPAKITVRLIRGELANKVVGSDVELVDLAKPDAPPRTVKTDADGRAAFSELPTGTYEARAVVDSEKLSSRPIELQPAPTPGIRVMLVFRKPGAPMPKAAAPEPPKDNGLLPGALGPPRPDKLPLLFPTPAGKSASDPALGTADNQAHVDPALPAGVVAVRVLDEGGQPLPGLPVFLARQINGQLEPVQPQNTDDAGFAHFSEQPTREEIVYMVAVRREGINHPSQPFNLAADHGAQVVLGLKPVVRDKSALSELKIGMGTHFILDMQDDTIQVMENLRVINPMPAPIDPGPEGLRVPLAEGALSPQPLPGSPPNVVIDASQAGPPAVVWKGAIPPGGIEIRVGFILQHHGELNFRQAVAQPFEGLRVIMEKLPGVKLEHVGDIEDRKWQGRDLMLASVSVPGVGSILEFQVTGLPAELRTLRYGAGVLAAAIALCFVLLAAYGKREVDQAAQKRRQKLEQKREALLAELIATDQREAEGAGESAARGKSSKTRPRDKTLADLEQIYRHLDELDGT